MKQHKHAKLIKAWADGAVIEYYNPITVSWCEFNKNRVDFNSEYFMLRIKPDCEYAIEEVRKLGGDEAVELYKYWLDGGEIKYQENLSAWHSWQPILKPEAKNENLFAFFYYTFSDKNTLNFRKNKRTVTQVLWVNPKAVWIDVDNNAKGVDAVFLSEATEVYGKGGNEWVKTDIVREIEVD